MLNAVAGRVPWLIGGSSDLAPSNKSRLTFEGAGDFSADDRAGRNLHFGVREHAAAAISNGLALSKLRAYQAGFLIFSDFQRGALRLSALMELPLIHIYTHDSIGVGEDGPTHQPIEHLASIRAMPGVIDMRPGDANEVVEAWRVLMPIRHEPVALMLSRQPLPTLDRTRYAPASGVARGAYVLADPPEGDPDVILIATGSEVGMTVAAYEQLTADGIRARVVSMPSMELFDKQPPAYREEVLPAAVTARVAVEKGSPFGWDRWVGTTGAVIGMSTFGESAPMKVLQAKFGFTTENIVATARAQLGLDHTGARGNDARIVGLMNRNLAPRPQRCQPGCPGWPWPPGKRSPLRHGACSVSRLRATHTYATPSPLFETEATLIAGVRVTLLTHQSGRRRDRHHSPGLRRCLTEAVFGIPNAVLSNWKGSTSCLIL